MKKLLKLLGIIAFVAVIGFSMIACSDDGDSSKNTGGNNGSAINPQGANVYLEYSAFPVSGINADVFMYIWGYYNSKDDYFEMPISTPIGKITNGKLSFTLPDVSAYADNGWLIAEEFGDYNRSAGDIKTETDEYSTWTSTVTKNTMEVDIPQDAKVLEGGIGFFHEGEEFWLYYGNETTYVGLYYFNKPGTLKGEFNKTDVTTYNNGNTSTSTYNYTYNCTFTAGWNVIYDTGSGGGVIDQGTITRTYNMSNNPPANAANMRWVADD